MRPADPVYGCYIEGRLRAPADGAGRLIGGGLVLAAQRPSAHLALPHPPCAILDDGEPIQERTKTCLAQNLHRLGERQARIHETQRNPREDH